MNIADMLNAITPEIYRKFQVAIETGKWANGKALTMEQKQICMQAVIVYEHKNLDENERTGFVSPSGNQCASNDHDKKAPDSPSTSRKIKLTQL